MRRSLLHSFACLCVLTVFVCVVGCARRSQRQVVVQQTPYGPRQVVVTTTTRTVEPPPAPPRPSDPIPWDALVRFNLDQVNRYRAAHGAPPLLYDSRMSAFAYEGSRRLSRDHVPHAHFAQYGRQSGFGTRRAENQGDPNGVPPMGPDALSSGQKQIGLMLKLMMDEGPGGGHYDNLVNPAYRRIGIGIFYVGGTLYLTNDFSD